ncbi:hypothetical protein NC652_001608 [Populus alba x Populus x berolinensis]|uniref:Uncharacterized protein n=1 Tax=Populus alba x Populus x berolinensis TaxID=444605 RepID=A0AAD6RLN1_9ROSI|nr:hypothetical protein NC652_001608 [Populus alba x Populus x berolinensis]KAJ7011279.1 hypothetical protein NC653_001647 [Populus alba x Populus x berolinensis]
MRPTLVPSDLKYWLDDTGNTQNPLKLQLADG